MKIEFDLQSESLIYFRFFEEISINLKKWLVALIFSQLRNNIILDNIQTELGSFRHNE